MRREEAIAKINRLRNEYNDQYIDYCGMNEAVNMAIEALATEPIKHGRWIETDRNDPCYYVCSLCGKRSDFKENYCPACGADMREVEE